MKSHDSECQSIRYVACVSYPRSGHHLTVRILSHYFGRDFKYCQYYNEPAGCCGNFPCTDSSVHLTKNHDMDLGKPLSLGLPKSNDVPYLVLVRNFLEAVVSDYNLYLRENEDTEDAWRQFSQRKSNFYQRFVNKWVLEDDGLEKLIMPYEKLTDDPIAEFSRMVQFFRPDQPIDRERLTRIVSDAVLEDVKPDKIDVIRKFGVRNRRKLEDFKYYDPVYFSELEAGLKTEFSQVGYPLRFAA